MQTLDHRQKLNAVLVGPYATAPGSVRHRQLARATTDRPSPPRDRRDLEYSFREYETARHGNAYDRRHAVSVRSTRIENGWKANAPLISEDPSVFTRPYAVLWLELNLRRYVTYGKALIA